MPRRGLLMAIDSIGIDPLRHDRPQSVYNPSAARQAGRPEAIFHLFAELRD